MRRVRRREAIVAVVLIGAACGTVRGTLAPPSPTSSAPASPAVSATAVPAATPTETAATGGAPPLPATYIAQVRGGDAAQLDLVDAASGQVLKQLTPAEAGGGSDAPTIPTDGSVVYFDQGNGTCGDNVLKVPVGGGTSTPALDLGHLDEGDSDEASGPPSVSGNGRLLAVGRENLCLTSAPSFIELAIIGTATGKQVVTDTSVDRPASTQAWSPDGTELLAIRDNGLYLRGGSGGVELHVLTVDPAGGVTGDRTLAPAPTGCSYASALFSPSSGEVIANVGCWPTSPGSVVELDPNTGTQIATVLSPQPGESVGAVAIDPTGSYLMYGSGPWPPSTTSTVRSWFDLNVNDGRSTPLPVPPNVTPEAWWPALQ